MKSKSIKPFAAALGATVLASALSPAAFAGSNPFTLNELGAGYQLAEHHEGAEGKCGEGKCGEKKAEGEGKCGEGKAAGEGSCGEKKAAGEGKCGEGKCGEKKPEGTTT